MAGILFFAATGVHPSYAQDMTAGFIMENMEPKERYAYVSGIVTGMAYARFRKDTIASGSRDESGMICIHNWFSKVSDVPAPPFALGREGRCSKPLRASTYADFRVYA